MMGRTLCFHLRMLLWGSCGLLAFASAAGFAGFVAERFDQHGALTAQHGARPPHCSPQGPRDDCGYFGIQQPECEARGCCWSPAVAPAVITQATGKATADGSSVPGAGSGSSGDDGGAAPSSSVPPEEAPGVSGGNDVPWCFFPNGQEEEPVYEVESVQPTDPGGAVTKLILRLRPAAGPAGGDPPMAHPAHIRRQEVPSLDPDLPFPRLEVVIEQQEAHRLYIRVQPAADVAEQSAAEEAAMENEEAEGDSRGGQPVGEIGRRRRRARPQGKDVYDSHVGYGDDADRAAGPAGRAGGTSEGAGARTTEQRWQVPEDLLPRPPAPSALPTAPQYRLQLPSVGQEFSLHVTRAAKPAARASTRATKAVEEDRGDAAVAATSIAGDSGDVLLHLSGAGCLVLKQQFLQLRAQVQADINLYGMGETTQVEGLRLPRDGSTRALWNSDTPAAAVGVNLYGSHPVLYGIAPSGASFGWFLANSNAMDFTAGRDDLTFRAVGGILELFLFCGPSPERVTAQYQEVVGRPAMPPRWALGFHQSRYGYGSVDELEQVVASYDQARIPLEVMWSDIDYTDRARMFTTDPQRYPLDRLRALVDSLHARGRRWVPIVDCGITALPGAGYEPYDRGLSYDVFFKDSSGRPLMGQVWSGPTHWPDFLHPNATPYWTGLLAEMHDKLPYDGLWLDMNEPSNFCTGECRLQSSGATSSTVEPGTYAWDAEAKDLAEEDVATAAASISRAAAATPGSLSGQLGITCVLDCTQPSADDPLSNPPYRVNNGNRHAPLYVNTVPLTAVGHGGVRQYDAHNLYALAESRVTHAALRAISPGARPFILTRSSWAGQGRYAAHWTGDNAASWDDLRRSAGGLLAASLAGMALAGADICGFIGATNEQLCARWLAAGAFYTFARDHSDLGSPPQEPYRWPLVAEAARNALTARYSLLPYLYTAFFLAHTRGGTVARPLVWAAPTDPRVADLCSQWLLGDALMVAPVLAPDTDQVEVYFPGPQSASTAGPGQDAYDADPDVDAEATLGGGGLGTAPGEARGSGTWCRYDDLAACYTGPSHHRIQSPLGAAPPLFLRAGTIVPTQPFHPTADPEGPVMTTSTVAASPLKLLVLLSAAGSSDRQVRGEGYRSRSRSSAGSSSASGSGSGASVRGAPRADLVAFGRLYADNGTDPDVGGPGSLRVHMAAGASLAEGSGWFEFRVDGAPSPAMAGLRSTAAWSLPRGTKRELTAQGQKNGRGNKGPGIITGSAADAEAAAAMVEQQSTPAAPGADVDVRQLRVGVIWVTGVMLPPQCPGLEVAVAVVGAAPVVVREGVQLDAAAHQLRVEGLDLSAVQSFRLTWKTETALTSPPAVQVT